jgi:RNA polymerase sigma factor (sigma-70 family)
MTDSEEVRCWYNFIDGDIDALSTLFLYYAKGLVSYGMKIYRDEELVKDSIQEVFIILIQKRHKLKRNEKIKGLVYRLLRNKIIDEIKLINRSRRIDDLIFDINNSFDNDAEHRQIGLEEETKRDSMINSALNQLSAHQKEAMFLKYSDGLSYELISKVMGISIASVRTLIYRTLKQLKLQLTENQSNEI